MNRMIKRWIGGLAIAATMMVGQAVFAMGGEHGKGDPKHPISNSVWHEGVSVLANRTERIGGHWLNSNDWFHYRGDAKAFNDFLKHYAQVKQKSLRLYLGDPKTSVTTAQRIAPDYDWEMSVTGWGDSFACVTLPLDNQIRLKDLKVPEAVGIEVVGTKTPEIADFLAKHKAEYDKFHSKEKAKKEDRKTLRLF